MPLDDSQSKAGPADRPDKDPAPGDPASQALSLPPSLFSFIWRYSKPQQIGLVLLSIAAFPILYASLELPKLIVNHIAEGIDARQSGMLDEVGLSGAINELVILCLMFLGLILINGAFKMMINIRKGVVGERMVRRLRYLLLTHVLRLRQRHLDQLSSGEVIATTTQETEPLAGFIGDSVAVPLYQAGTMLTILIFMFVQDPYLGLASVALIPVQGVIIPRLQKRVNMLAKERVRHVRALSERIGETMDGAQDLRRHGLHRYILSDFSRRLGDIFRVRLAIYRRKFFIKFLNNFINQVTPFFFYLIGGILAINGNLSLGALVAAIAAFKDLTAPWKELLGYYQRLADSRVKYEQLQELFAQPDLYPDLVMWEPGTQPGSLRQDIVFDSVSYRSELGEQVLSGFTLTIPAGKTTIIQGDSERRRTRVARLIAGDVEPASGSVRIGGVNITDIPASTRAWRLGYAGPSPYIVRGTITENASYGLRLQPPAPQPGFDSDRDEARRSGNLESIDDGSWKDLRTLGFEDLRAFKDWWIEVTHVIDSAPIIYRRGLSEVFDPAERPRLAATLIQARAVAAQNQLRPEHAGLIARFDASQFNPTLTLFENLAFGTPAHGTPTPARMLLDPAVLKELEAQDLREPLKKLRAATHEFIVNRIRTGALTEDCVARYDFLDRETVQFLTSTYDRKKANGFDSLSPEEQARLGDFVLTLTEDRHKLGFIDEGMKARIVAIRGRVQAALGDKVVPFDPLNYHACLTVQENVLFGRPYFLAPAERVEDLTRTSLMAIEGAVEDIMFLLMESQAGIGGSRLPLIARQRVAMSRWLLKRPDILVVDEALTTFDDAQKQQMRRRIRQSLPEVTLVWIDDHPTLIDDADVVVTLGEGRVQSVESPQQRGERTVEAEI